MNLYEFYYSTSMLLVRLGYAVDLDQLDLKSGNDKAAKINKWYERITAGLDFFFDIEMPSRTPVHIPLDKFSEEKLEALKSNWQSLTRDLPLAGLRYSHGKPIVFGARVIHQVNESAIKDLFERLQDEFVKFSSNYEIAFSESGYNISIYVSPFPVMTVLKRPGLWSERTREASGRAPIRSVG